MGSSSITGDETILFADNMSFDGTPRGGKMTTDGQLFIGSTASRHIRLGTLTPGTGVSITNGPGTITIAAASSVALSFPTDSGTATPSSGVLNVLGTGGCTTSGAGNTVTINAAAGFTWNNVTAASATLAKNNGYQSNNAGLVTLTMPSVASSTFGDTIKIGGLGAGGWLVQCVATQLIHFGSTVTSAAGSLASTNRYDQLELVCSSTTTEWFVRYAVGNLTVV